ncbi:MAG: transposase [Verrucomicrobia bacterium]|nr:transposase [Verrucomicrobiota bacterium]
MFKPFQPDQNVKRHRGNLPHWRQDDVTYFVNGRLADSIPKAKLRLWDEERTAWLAQHGFRSKDELDSIGDEEKRSAFHARFTKQWHDWLDAGWGACVLRDASMRQHLIDQFLASTEEMCDLDVWVIMPNHFHALVTPKPGMPLGDAIQKWKGSSSRAINVALNRNGKLWQAEPFDHIVRSESQWHHYRNYIANNPIKPNLPESDYAIGIGKAAWASAQELRNQLEKERKKSS